MNRPSKAPVFLGKVHILGPAIMQGFDWVMATKVGGNSISTSAQPRQELSRSPDARQPLRTVQNLRPVLNPVTFPFFPPSLRREMSSRAAINQLLKRTAESFETAPVQTSSTLFTIIAGTLGGDYMVVRDQRKFSQRDRELDIRERDQTLREKAHDFQERAHNEQMLVEKQKILVKQQKVDELRAARLFQDRDRDTPDFTGHATVVLRNSLNPEKGALVNSPDVNPAPRYSLDPESGALVKSSASISSKLVSSPSLVENVDFTSHQQLVQKIIELDF